MRKQISMIGLAALAAACGAGEPGSIERGEDPVDVVVSLAAWAAGSESFAASVVSERNADVATRISGTIRAVHVELGAAVREGEPLVTLDDRDIAARVRSARAALELAETSHGRTERLVADNVASRQELDQSTSTLASARSALAEAEAQESYAVVRAPFGGIVTSRRVDPGDLATPGQPLVSIMDPAALKVVADLPANRAGTLAIGDPVEIEIVDAGADVREGEGARADGFGSARIVRIAPAFGGGSRTFRIEAHLDRALPGVYPGAYARVRLGRSAAARESGVRASRVREDATVADPGDPADPTDPADPANSGAPGDAQRGGTRWIPEDAIVERGQLRGVFAVEDDVVRLRWVRLGERRDGAVELLAGPAGMTTVVRRPGIGLSDGRAVGSIRTEAWSPSLPDGTGR